MQALLVPVVLLIAVGAEPLPRIAAAQDERPASSSEDPRALVEKLIERTKSLTSFTAVYSAVVKDKESKLRLVYQSPGRGRLDSQKGGDSIKNWVVDGRIVMRFDTEGNRSFAETDFAKAFEDDHGFAKALETNFPPTGKRSEDLGAGPSFMLGAASKKEGDRSFTVEMKWTNIRHHFLLWLGRPEEWADAKLEGERLVRRHPDGTTEALSTRTGFIEEIVRPDGARLRLVELRESAEDSEFVVPPPEKDMRDESAGLEARTAPLLLQLRRNAVYVRASNVEDLSSEASKTKLWNLFDVLYTPILTARFEYLLKTAGPEIDRFSEWCRTGWTETAKDADTRAKLENTIAERRSLHQRQLEDSVKDQVSKMHPIEGPNIDAQRAAVIHAIEGDVFRSVAQRELGDRLMAKFDEGIAAAKSGK